MGGPEAFISSGITGRFGGCISFGWGALNPSFKKKKLHLFVSFGSRPPSHLSLVCVSCGFAQPERSMTLIMWQSEKNFFFSPLFFRVSLTKSCFIRRKKQSLSVIYLWVLFFIDLFFFFSKKERQSFVKWKIYLSDGEIKKLHVGFTDLAWINAKKVFFR